MRTQDGESSQPPSADNWRAPAARFAVAAERFVSWLDDRSTPLTARACQRHLVALYSAGFELLEPDLPLEQAIADDPRIDDAAWKSIFRRGAELPFQFYWVALNPHELDEDAKFGTGDLSDDLADIYRDLTGPLALHRNGDLDSAAWHWHFGFHHHWGEHAIAALNALHQHPTN